MWVICIETSSANDESLEFIHLSLNMLEILDLIKPDLQRKSGTRCIPLLCSLDDNPVKMWYETSFMMSLSMENFGKICRAFSTLYIRMKVPRGKAY